MAQKLPRLARAMSLTVRTERLLRDAIREGRFPGGRLPPARELAAQLGVSRETVRKAEGALEREGLLAKFRRRGTLLRPPAMTLGRARASTLIGYLQAEYPSGGGAASQGSEALMLQGALREAGRAGCELVVRVAPHTELDVAARALLDGTRLRGVVFVSCGEEKLVREALGRGLPTVLLDHDLHLPRISSDREDAAQGAELAVRHLAGLGHERIAFAHWRFSDLNPWRLEGYRAGLRGLGLTRRRAWELFVELSDAGARGVVESLAALRPAPTALLCFNNRLARAVIERLERKGLRVPGDLSVVGGGGEEVPGLTCHQADWAGMGRKAVRLLLRAGRERPPEHLLFPHSIRPGRSSGPLP